MISKPFDKARPADESGRIGWDAEKQMAFMLARAFEHALDVFVFNDLRLATGSGVIASDFVQMDHLVLHRHGIAIIESKATGGDRGEFHVDELGQWLRRSNGQRPGFNMPSPLAQATRQIEALRAILSAARPHLLRKRFGFLQARFENVPMTSFVAIADNTRLTGRVQEIADRVMKAEQIVAAIRSDIAAKGGDFHGIIFSDGTVERIVAFLLENHRPAVATPAPTPLPAKSAESLPRPSAHVRAGLPASFGPGPVAARPESPEAMTCRHCRSINVRVVHRRDYCLQCDECSRYSPLNWICRRCGKPATIRKRGAEIYRACDKDGGCGSELVFWRDEPAKT